MLNIVEQLQNPDFTLPAAIFSVVVVSSLF